MRRVPRQRSFAAAAVLLLCTCHAHAQLSPGAGAAAARAVQPVQDPALQLLDEQKRQERQRQLNEPPPSISVAPTAPEQVLDIPLDTPVPQIVETGPVFPVSRIELKGPDGTPLESTAVSQATLDAIVVPFAHQDLGSHRVNVLLKRLTDAYVAAGYVTTRALLGPQNLASGTLVITIQIGHVGAFTVNGQPIRHLQPGESAAGGGWITDAGYENAFPLAPGDALRLEDLDQGVSQINRMRRNQAEVQILPGQSAGQSIVAIRNPPADRLYYNLGVDNYGSKATGVTRYRAGVEANNVIGLQESLSLNFIDSLESNAIVGSFAIPFGRHTFSYTFSDSEYQQLAGTTAVIYGRTLGHIFGWNYGVKRTPADLVNLDATLSWRRTDRTVNGFDLNPQHIAVLRVGGNWLHKFAMNNAQGNVTLDAGVSQGLSAFEADHNAPGISRFDAHGQFTKLDATATFTVPLPRVANADLAWRGRIGGQYANVALFGSEQLFLGGMDTIRGFRAGQIAGDRGLCSRNEIAWVNVPAWHDARIEPYVFLDAGKASLVAIGGFPSLVGTGAGARAQWQWSKQILTGELTIGRALTQPAALGPKATLVLATANWNF
jgi:hemolysin activation/secretion protein